MDELDAGGGDDGTDEIWCGASFARDLVARRRRPQVIDSRVRACVRTSIPSPPSPAKGPETGNAKNQLFPTLANCGTGGSNR